MTEADQLRAVRDRLIHALAAATGATIEEVKSGPLTAALRVRAEIERLHAERDEYKRLYEAGCENWRPVYIDVLKDRDRLRAALKPFADAYWDMVSNESDDTLTGSDDITAGDVRRARAALNAPVSNDPSC